MTLQLVTFRRSKTEVALKSSVKHESRLLLTVTLFITFRRSKTEVALKSSVKHESRLLLTVTLFIFPSVTK